MTAPCLFFTALFCAWGGAIPAAAGQSEPSNVTAVIGGSTLKCTGVTRSVPG